MTVQQAFALGVQHHQAGRLAEAETLYRQILATQPDHVDALHLLGLVQHQAGHHEIALELIGRALALRPNHPAAHSNHGAVFRSLRRFDEAIAAHRRAVDLLPQSPDFHLNLGNSLLQAGRFEEALAAFQESLRWRPDFAQAHSGMGIALIELGRLDPAESAFRRALQFDPGNPRTHRALGLALATQGRLDDAIAAFRSALTLDAADPEAHNLLGTALATQGKKMEALAAFRKAVELRADFASAWNNLAAMLTEGASFDEAIFSFHRAVALEPDSPRNHCNLGATLARVGRYAEAIAAYRQALAIDANWADAWSNLIYALHYDPHSDRGAIAREKQAWKRQMAEPLQPCILPHPNSRDPERRLRIGYVSVDFRDHVVGRNLRPLFAFHDHHRFEIFCYSCNVLADALTEEFRRRADVWRETAGHSDEELGAAIRSDGIDILVDLAQHTSGNRLLTFARKPAPVQASFAGYPESTGLETIEYRISDRWLEKGTMNDEWRMIEAAETKERVFLLDSFWCYDPYGMDVSVNDLPVRSNGHITFGCLNRFCKFNEPVLRLWAQVLTRRPTARLLLLCAAGSHRQRTLECLTQQGVSPQRIEFLEARPRREYLELYHRLDILLDSFPYSGHTTSLDALWMGVPVVSLCGEQSVSRAGLSQLSNLGLPDLVAHSPEEYVEIAARLAGDVTRLAELRRTLRPRMEASVLMDAPRFARNIESAYRAMWRHWCADDPTGPASCPPA